MVEGGSEGVGGVETVVEGVDVDVDRGVDVHCVVGCVLPEVED